MDIVFFQNSDYYTSPHHIADHHVVRWPEEWAGPKIGESRGVTAFSSEQTRAAFLLKPLYGICEAGFNGIPWRIAECFDRTRTVSK
jgi:hypothetical protein